MLTDDLKQQAASEYITEIERYFISARAHAADELSRHEIAWQKFRKLCK